MKHCIQAYIDKLISSHIDIHSIHILKNNQLMYGQFAPPYQKKSLHRMFSIAKSMTSLAIGFLADEEKLSLDDLICDYFPEYISEKTHPYVKAATIRHLLTMNTPFKGTVYDKHCTDDWSRPFFETAPDKMPGTFFSYDTSAAHVLCALVEKLSKTSLLAYLKSKGVPFSSSAYMLKDKKGVSMGGSGLVCSAEDIVNISQILMKNDNSVFPAWYVEDATAYQTDTVLKSTFCAEQYGYGYLFWRIRDGFMMYGLGGQLSCFFPEKQLLLITTADCTDRKDGVSLLIESFYDTVFPCADSLNPLTSPLPPVKMLSASPIPQKFCGIYEDLTVLTDSICLYGFTIKNKDRSFCGYPALCSGGMIGADRARFHVKLTEEIIGNIVIDLLFKNQAVHIFMKNTEETQFKTLQGYKILKKQVNNLV